jgi:hypothetical protein
MLWTRIGVSLFSAPYRLHRLIVEELDSERQANLVLALIDVAL